jgi:hypothetical protein
MQLKGSCHCGAVKFRLQSDSPVPFMHCYWCNRRRKASKNRAAAIGQQRSFGIASVRLACCFLWRALIFGLRSCRRDHLTVPVDAIFGYAVMEDRAETEIPS